MKNNKLAANIDLLERLLASYRRLRCEVYCSVIPRDSMGIKVADVSFVKDLRLTKRNAHCSGRMRWRVSELLRAC